MKVCSMLLAAVSAPRDGALEVRLVAPARVERVELRCEMTQDEWLIVRELGALPCGEKPRHDEL